MHEEYLILFGIAIFFSTFVTIYTTRTVVAIKTHFNILII